MEKIKWHNMYYFKKEEYKKFRKIRKLTQQGMADALGKASYKTVLRWERGISMPSEAEIRLSAQVLGVTVDEISDLKEISGDIRPHYYDSMTNLDRSVFDYSTKTESEKQKLLIDYFNQNKMFIWKNRELKKLLSDSNRIINSLNYMVYKKNRELKYTFVNDQFLSYFGISGLNLILGQRNKDIRDDWIKWQKLTDIEEETFRTKCSVVDKVISFPNIWGYNGKGLLNINPIVGEDGKVNEIVCSIKDISGEQTVREKYMYMESVLEKLGHVIWIIKNDPYRHYIYINDAIENIYGVVKNEFYKNVDFWLNMVHNDDKEKVNYALNNNEQKVIYRIYSGGGKIKWLQHHLYKTLIEENIIEFAIIQDITDSMESERIRRMMETTIDSMKETFGLVRAGTNDYIYFSKTREDVYGYPIKQLIDGAHEFWLHTCVHPDDYEEQQLYTDTSWPAVRRFRIVRGDGEVRWLEARVTKINFNGMDCTGCFESDITEEIEAEEKHKGEIKKAFKKGEKESKNKIVKFLKEKGIAENIISAIHNL